MALSFVLIDESSALANTPALGGPLNPAILTQMAASLEIQLNRDVAVYWGGGYSVRAGKNSADVATGETVCAIVDSLPSAPGAIAYHDVMGNGVPVVFIGRSLVSSLISGNNSLSAAISHELCETAGDAECNLWADDSGGFSWARELCDAVESNFYDIGGVSVSDFVLPAFFANGAMGPFSFCQANGLSGSFPHAAFATAIGGYQVRRNIGTGDTQINGKNGMRAARAAKAINWSSRLSRRGVK